MPGHDQQTSRNMLRAQVERSYKSDKIGLTNEEAISFINDLIEKENEADRPTRLYEQYSGRGMFGRSCIGVVTCYPDHVLAVASDAGIKNGRTDSLGRQYIVYWPHITSTVTA